MTRNTLKKGRRVISIIPARGGSKRFKNKNTAVFCHHPLSLWTFSFVQNSGLFDIGYVNTDIPELISSIDNYNNLEYCERSPDLSTDDSTILDVVRDTCVKKSLHDEDIIVLLPVTGVLRTYEDVSLGICEYLKGDGEAVVSVSESSYPAGMLWKKKSDNYLTPLLSHDFKMTTQKQKHFPTYMFNDLFVIDTVGNFLNFDRNLYGNRTKAFITPQERFMPIDYQYQFFLAEKLFELGQESGIYPSNIKKKV